MHRGPRAKPEFDWNDDAVETLCVMWMGNETPAAIATALGLTKNQVLGKAHRLNLPAKPNPVTGAASKTRPAFARFAGKTTLPPVSPPPAPSAEPKPVVAATPRTETIAVVPAALRLPRPPPAPMARLPSLRRCAYPMWPTTREYVLRTEFPYCDAPTARGSYCEEHAARCYTQERWRL